MTLNINVTPREEAWLATEAAKQGLSATEVVRRLIGAHIPAFEPYNQGHGDEVSDPTDTLFAQWAEEDAESVPTAKTLEAIAYLEARIAEGRNASPEARRLADKEVAELRQGLNANRIATGERQI
jgi:hypothetical protein